MCFCPQVFARLAPGAGESLGSLAKELHVAKADGFILQRDWVRLIDSRVSTCREARSLKSTVLLCMRVHVCVMHACLWSVLVCVCACLCMCMHACGQC